MAFKKLNTYTLPGTGSTTQVKLGEVVVSKGSNATALRFKVSLQLTNSGAVRGLTPPERVAFLDSFDYSLTWGAGLQYKPRSNVSFGRERVIIRQMMGSELEGFNDTSTGLARSIGSGATTVEWYQRIHLCGTYKDPDTDSLFGVGPSQAASIQMDMRRLSPVLPSGFAVSGTVTLDLIPDEFPSKYDRVTPIPRWHEFSEANKVANFLPGLTWYAVERSAPHVSTAFAEVSLSIDGWESYSRVTPGEYITRWLDVPNYTAENQTFDADTVLHLLTPGQRMRDWPTGTLRLEQDRKTIATMQMGQLVTEVADSSAIERDIAYFASKKGRRISAVSLPTLLGQEVPKNLLPFVPYALLDEQDAEFDRYPGLMAAPSEDPRIYFPGAVTARAKARVQMHESAREYLAGENVIRELAAPVPGAVQSPRGWGQSSTRYLETARAVVRG
ncbi:hypothetical protein DRW03_06350 [Corallococcus sp. H22C18031201]|nr:hypothetical protein DRW03_06350 [Corallococcus sp. H22C18031201]